jgi:RNA polymerase sigma-70 factor (ECF subfamily)
MDASDEADLVRRAKAGDGRAFDGLIGSYVQVVYNLSLRMVGNREDARDLTQCVFLKAWRGLGRFDDHKRFFSWLYRIALNESLNLLRGRRPVEKLNERFKDPSPSPDEQFALRERDEALQAALMDLEEGHRQLIVLHHFAELSYAELGQLLDLPERMVKSRLFTARRMLGRILKRRGFRG